MDKAFYHQILEDLPSLMESNINDEIGYDPWEPETNKEHLLSYIEDIQHEINYEIEENYDTYSKEELDKLQNTINEIKAKLQ